MRADSPKSRPASENETVGFCGNRLQRGVCDEAVDGVTEDGGCEHRGVPRAWISFKQGLLLADYPGLQAGSRNGVQPPHMALFGATRSVHPEE